MTIIFVQFVQMVIFYSEICVQIIYLYVNLMDTMEWAECVHYVSNHVKHAQNSETIVLHA